MLENLFFDWYSASIEASPDLIISSLKTVYKHSSLELSRPQNGFTHGDKLVDQHGETLVTLWYGGSKQGGRVMAFASGIHAQQFSVAVRSLFPDHELIRADAAIDFDYHGVYLCLIRHGIRTSRAVSVKNRFIGEAGSEFSLEHSEGRSLYLGSRSSVSMIRIYEKGKKDDKSRLDWVRSEFEFKPKGADARSYYAKASIQEIVGSTKLGRAFFSGLGVSVAASPIKPGTVRVKTDHDRAMEHLRSQYHNVIQAELARNGGSFEQLGITLSQRVA